MKGGTVAHEPSVLGPYRLLERLGKGGMGEVFLAYDERLGRQVAIKRIRSDSPAAGHRERFLREASLAARLNHPAIVQIHDVLIDGDDLAIVMERVEGESLRQLLRQGRLDLAGIVRVARDVARGLEAAHRQGIVHRDLKSENVLVTAAGAAKIADFGVAKDIARSGEPGLTTTGMVLGTCRTMSPEQARGEAVDHRSDLFSFGVLLYEALSGRSPFEAENDLATLQKVLTHRPPPLCEAHGEVPEELSRLVDQLLEKDPRFRPRSAAEVAGILESLPDGTATSAVTLVDGPRRAERTSPGTGRGGTGLADSAFHSFGARLWRQRPWTLGLLLAAALGLGLYGAVALLRRTAPPLTVAVLAPASRATGTADADLLAANVRTALLRQLLALEGISPKAFDEVDAARGTPMAVARAVAAGEVVTSRLDCRPETCQVTLQRLAGRDGTVLWAESFPVPTDNYFLAANAVAAQIRRAYRERQARAGSAPLEVESADLALFLRLRARLDAGGDDAFGAVEEGLAALRARAPRFLDAYLLEVRVARLRFYDSRDPKELEHAFALIEKATRLAPGDPEPLLSLFDTAVDAHDLRRAEEALAELDRLVPGDADVLERRARLAMSRSQPEEALRLETAAVRRQPSARRLVNLARFELWQGRIDLARAHLEQALRQAPQYFDGLSLLAQLELTHGEPRRAAALYRELLGRTGGLSERSNLGLAYLLLGDYGQAAAAFAATVEKEPGNPFFALNLADAKLLSGQRSEAAALYRRVVALAAADKAAATPQWLTVKAQALAHLGQGRSAVAAVQEALRLAPRDGPVAFEAALVYTLLGEQDSALVNAERALKLGFEARWFSLPWFATLRQRPELAALLAAPGAPR